MPPLDRHQFGGALGGALVIPGMYDGHNRTFFFADYPASRSGAASRRSIPCRRCRRGVGDFSNYRDRNGNLIPIYDPLTTRLDAARDGSSATSSRTTSSRRIGIHAGRPEHRQPLPAAEQRLGQLRQLHLDARSRDHRQRVLGPRRSPDLRQRLVLRPLQLRQVQARRAAGPGELLSADAGRGGGAVRPRAVRRRHPEHAADDAWRGVQLLEGAQVDARQRAARSATPAPSRSRPNRTTATTRRSRSASAASTSTTSRPGCRTSTSRTSRACQAARASCRSTRSSSTIRSKTRWCG